MGQIGPVDHLRMSLQYLKNLGKYMYSQKYSSCWFTVLCVPQIRGAGEQGHNIYYYVQSGLFAQGI